MNLSLEPALPKRSLFNDGAAVDLSLIILHSATVLARASDSEAELCFYTDDTGGVIDDVGGTVDNNNMVSLTYFS